MFENHMQEELLITSQTIIVVLVFNRIKTCVEDRPDPFQLNKIFLVIAYTLPPQDHHVRTNYEHPFGELHNYDPLQL